MKGRRHLRLIPGDAQHVLLVEGREDDYVDVSCTCGKDWGLMPDCFLEALSEYHEGALFA